MNPQTTEQLTSLDSRELFQKIEVLRDRAEKLGREEAEANKRYRDLKELMPSFLAEIQMILSKTGESYSNNRMRALASKEYQDRVKMMNEAEREARLVDAERRAVIESFRALTSVGYVRNQEMKLAR